MWSTYPFGNKVVVRATRELLDGTYGVVVHKGDLGIVRLTGDGYPVVDFRGQSVPCGPEEIEYVGYDTIDTGTDEPYDPAELPIKVLHSPAGYYIGQLEPGGAPYSRLSDCYYKKREDAEKALAAGWPSGRDGLSAIRSRPCGTRCGRRGRAVSNRRYALSGSSYHWSARSVFPDPYLPTMRISLLNPSTNLVIF